MNEAYITLSDEEKRAYHNDYLAKIRNWIKESHLVNASDMETAEQEATETAPESAFAYTTSQTYAEYRPKQDAYQTYPSEKTEAPIAQEPQPVIPPASKKTLSEMLPDLSSPNIQMRALKKLGMILGLSILGAIVLPYFISDKFPVLKSIAEIMTHEVYPIWMSNLILPILYCGWGATSFFEKQIIGEEVYDHSIIYKALLYSVKMVIIFFLGLFIIPFYLLVYITIFLNPEIIGKIKKFRYFVY